MIVSLAELRPNTLRDFKVDPLNEAAVLRLMASIKEDGFWGGVVCRATPEGPEIVAGHHRIEAALRLGIKKADLFVAGWMDDETAIRIYARENATQRGMSDSTARAGSTASALRMVAYGVLTGDVALIKATSEKALDIINGQIKSGKGIGRELIERQLAGVPGINKQTINQDLASLKKSRHYARIMEEVRDRIIAEAEEAERLAEAARGTVEVARGEENGAGAQYAAESREREAEAARRAAEAAKQAAAAAAKEEKTFDYDGVSPHFGNPHQLQVFRDCVTREVWRKYIPLSRQAEIAARIVAEARKEEAEPDGYYIQTCFATLAAQMTAQTETVSEEEREKDLRVAWSMTYMRQQNTFMSALRGAVAQGNKLVQLLDERPVEIPLAPTPMFWEEVGLARQLIVKIEEMYEQTRPIAGTNPHGGTNHHRDRPALEAPGRGERAA